MRDRFTEYIENEFQSPPERDLIEIRTSATAAIEKSQLYSESHLAEKRISVKKYEIGDYVVIRNVDVTIGTNKKFVPKYKGPYVVHKVLPNDRYVVRDVENCQITQRPYNGIVEAARIKRWVNNSEG